MSYFDKCQTCGKQKTKNKSPRCASCATKLNRQKGVLAKPPVLFGSDNGMFNKTHSDEARKRIGNSGDDNTLRKLKSEGKRFEVWDRPGHYQKMNEASLKSQKRKNTSIEIEFENFCIKNNIHFEKQFRIENKFYDFKIENTLIEINGDYWHCNPDIYAEPINEVQTKAIENDKLKKKLAQSNGFELITFWEKDIRNNPEKTFTGIKNYEK